MTDKQINKAILRSEEKIVDLKIWIERTGLLFTEMKLQEEVRILKLLTKMRDIRLGYR
jgi:hypothetical protein|tara:strand:+ start:1436 stop:1609 length:174 start_codon:yes stop_codon:yes gene_type:complete